MASKHYHVLQGLGGGYMPNTNYYADTLASARDSLRAAKQDFLDSAEYRTGRKVSGSLKSGFILCVDNSDPYDLGEYAEIIPCTDDCDPDADY
jgi:hypothetical protein